MAHPRKCTRMATVQPYSIQVAADMEPFTRAVCRFYLTGVTASIPCLS